ncbi:dockerin type I domain-containing protein, partial [Candidatus Omnitrophota bacterium]
DEDGNVLVLTIYMAEGETSSEADLLMEVISESLDMKRLREEVIAESKRLKKNAVTPEIENIMAEAIKEHEEDNSKLSAFVESINAFLVRYEDGPASSEAAALRAEEITDLVSDLKVEIATLRDVAIGTTIRDMKTAIGECLTKKMEMETLVLELERLAADTVTEGTTAAATIEEQVKIASYLDQEAGELIAVLAFAMSDIADSDGDLYSDDEEALHKTNHMDYFDNIITTGDVDGDTYSNSLELQVGSDPEDISVTPDNFSEVGFVSDTRKDSDYDGAPDWIELILGTQIDSADTDGDLFTDYEEIRLGTDPLDVGDKPASEAMKALVHAPAWHKTQLTLDSIEKADIDGDGAIDLQDIITLNVMMSNFADLNEDRVVDQSDILRMKDMVHFASLNVSLADIERADISGALGEPDGKVDEFDIEAITEGLMSYKDVNSDGVVDEEDVALVRELKDLGLQAEDAETVDINGDGRVTDADLNILDRVLSYNAALTLPPWEHMELMDKVLEWLSLEAGTVGNPGPFMDINGDSTVDVMDLHKLNEILDNIMDVNLDGITNRSDCDRILQIVGQDKLEQLISSEQIRRANVDGNGDVDINDYNLIKSLYDRLRAGDVNGDGTVDDGTDVDTDTGAIEAIIEYTQLLEDWGITEENMESGDLNNDGKVDAVDLQLYDNAYNTLYSDNTINRDGVNITYPAADFNYDGRVTSDDKEYLEAMIANIYTTGILGALDQPITGPEWIEIINGIKQADFNNDRILDTLDQQKITDIMAKLKDVDGNLLIGTADDSYSFDALLGTIEIGSNGIADDLDKIMLIIEKNKYDFSDGELIAADMAGGEDIDTLYGGPDGVVDTQDMIAFADAVGNYLWRDLNGDGKLSEDDILIHNAISHYQQTRQDLNMKNMSVFDINYEDQYGRIQGDGVINQADVENMERHMNNLVDLNDDNIIDYRDKDLFLAITNASIYGYMDVSLLGITSQQSANADINGDGRVSLADRQMLIDGDGDVDGDGDGWSSDTDDQIIFDLIHEYINPYKLGMCDINGDGTVNMDDYTSFSADLAQYEGSDALAQYDIDGDDDVDADDLSHLEHILEDWLAYDITQEMYDECDIAPVIGKVDEVDREWFKRSYGTDQWGNPYGYNLWRLDMNGDSNVNEADLEFMEQRVTWSFVKTRIPSRDIYSPLQEFLVFGIYNIHATRIFVSIGVSP